MCTSDIRTPPPALADQLATLQRAIDRRETLRLTYTAGDGTATERNVRPLWIALHGTCWYLGAYCLLRQAERTFRVDRIGVLAVIGRRARRGSGYGRRSRPAAWPATPRPRRARLLAAGTGFFPPPPDPPLGSPLVRIWLVEE